MGLVVAGLFLVALWIVSPDPTTPVPDAKLAPPSMDALFGRDHLGRDVLARIVHGGALTLGLSILATVITAIVGTIAALIGGYRPSRPAAHGIEVGVQTLLAFPSLWLPLVAVAFFGSSGPVLVIALVLTSFPTYYWVMLRDVRALARQPFTEAAEVLGLRPWRVMFIELLPHLRRPVLALSLLNFRHTVVAMSTLAFLGLGPGVSTPTWGLMISEGRPYFPTFWWETGFPSIVLVACVVAAGLIERRIGRPLSPLPQL